MDIFRTIADRGTYRGIFRNSPIPQEDLRSIAEAGCHAPSGKNAQTTRFIVINDNETKAAIRAALPDRPEIRTAQAFIACVIDQRPEAVYEGYDFQIEDNATAVQNMLLAMTALGYASVWLDGMLRLQGRAQNIGAILGIPEEKIIRVLLPIGAPAEEYPRPKKLPFESRVFFNHWSSSN